MDRREIVIDPMTAYQITAMMEGVVQRGTGTALRSLGRPVAGKTGTTNDEKDVVGSVPITTKDCKLWSGKKPLPKMDIR